MTAVLSIGAVCSLRSVLPKNVHALSAVFIPFVLAYCLYWSPVWLGSDRSEYGAWAALAVGGWSLAGFIPSAVAVLAIQKRRDRMIREK